MGASPSPTFPSGHPEAGAELPCGGRRCPGGQGTGNMAAQQLMSPLLSGQGPLPFPPSSSSGSRTPSLPLLHTELVSQILSY